MQPRELVERVDAELRVFYGDAEALSPALLRRYEAERKYRLECVDRGYDPGDRSSDWVIHDIRCGEWERRAKLSLQNLLRDRARLARIGRDRAPVVHAPAHLQNRARGLRTRRVHRVSSSSRSDDPHDPAPARGGLQRLQRLRVVAPDCFRRDVAAWLGADDR